MNVIYRCPQCSETTRAEVNLTTRGLVCTHCQTTIAVDESSISESTQGSAEVAITRCLVCPSKELFVRKNFPQRVGVGIVVAGILASSVAWYSRWILTTYGILFFTAFLDVALYLWVGEIVQCYLCQAQYRGVDLTSRHEPFNLETHEKYRQMAARTREHNVR